MMVSVIALWSYHLGKHRSAGHISDDDLERYVFGRDKEPELATLEEHI